MCRILGYLGPPVDLHHLLYGSAVPFARQAHAPRYQDVGRINADGWGVGWWDLEIRNEPARYRTVTPMWADNRFRETAPLLRSTSVVAAIRNASPGAPIDESGNAPFTSGPWLFAHNGFVDGFRLGLGERLRREVSERRASAILGAADSEVLFAMVLDRIDGGATASEALLDLLEHISGLADGRFNFLLGDGQSLVATRWGNSLFLRELPAAATDQRAMIIVSEPLSLDPDWTEVPDRSIVTMTTTPSLDASTITSLPFG